MSSKAEVGRSRQDLGRLRRILGGGGLPSFNLNVEHVGRQVEMLIRARKGAGVRKMLERISRKRARSTPSRGGLPKWQDLWRSSLCSEPPAASLEEAPLEVKPSFASPHPLDDPLTTEKHNHSDARCVSGLCRPVKPARDPQRLSWRRVFGLPVRASLSTFLSKLSLGLSWSLPVSQSPVHSPCLYVRPLPCILDDFLYRLEPASGCCGAAWRPLGA